MLTRLALSFFVLVLSLNSFARDEREPLFFARASAHDSNERTRIANAGIAIDAVFSDGVTFIATQREVESLRKLGIKVEITSLPDRSWDFPGEDSAFHNYAEMKEALEAIVKSHPDVASLFSIGKSLQGRDLLGVRLSTSPDNDSLPTAIFLGCHHAREHLSVEIPLMLAQHLAKEASRDSRVRDLLATREVWIVPMVNPDGAEHDIDQAGSRYKWWRKNRRDNGDGTFGVDLNRNYGGSGWGGPGSSASPSSDTYRGTEAFSEPETRAVRDFVRARKRATVLLTYHTFSELILWPWGHKHDHIANETDRKVFETMGNQMATWNKYKPQKSSQLYLASGDTTDWAYEELKLFAFTFELSPSSLFGGGFYPGAQAIEPTFRENVEPALYLIESSENPYKATAKIRDPLGILN